MLTEEIIRNIRGFNYTPSNTTNDISFWRDYDENVVERELTFAQRLGLNSARVFLSYVVYEHDSKKFLDRIRHFIRSAYKRGITTLIVVWDSCFGDAEPKYDMQTDAWIPNPGVMNLNPNFWPKGERYCADLIQSLGPEPGLLMWDVMNEPLLVPTTKAPSQDTLSRYKESRIFVDHFCEFFKRTDTRHSTTVGVWTADDLSVVGDLVDVLSFHDYSATRAEIFQSLRKGLSYADQFKKLAFVSEISCPARANPYDVSIQACQEFGFGWYTWDLMIGESFFRDIHGIVYPDGTVRDPSIVSALLGFFRKREGEVVKLNLDKEGVVTRVLNQADTWLAAEDHESTRQPYLQGLSALESMANFIEAGEILAMTDLPSRKIISLAKESTHNREEVNRLLREWGSMLKRFC